MLTAKTRAFLATPIDKSSRVKLVVWVGLSMALGLVFSVNKSSFVFNAGYVVQDDARQFVFWMQRFSDPGLFPGDLIADYYQSLSPAGYAALFKIANWLSIEPFTLARFLPVILGLIATAYCFAVSVQILPVPWAAFLVTLTLNQCLSLRPDLVSATPRAFFCPLFLAFIFYLLRRSLVSVLLATALLGLFYPQGALLAAAILPLTLVRYEERRFRLTRNRQDYILCAAGIAVIMLLLLAQAWSSRGYGPIVTAEQARAMPEYSSEGRLPFFYQDPRDFWINGQLSGVLPGKLPALAWVGFLLPFLLLWQPRRDLAASVTGAVGMLPRIAIASLALFFLAHAALARLYFPSRYTQHSLLYVLSIAGGLAMALLIDVIMGLAERLPKSLYGFRHAVAPGVMLLLVYVAIGGVPLNKLGRGNHVDARHEAVYDFFSAQPGDSLIATLSTVGDNIPTFSKRSVLVAREYALPIHTGYYSQMSERTVALIDAHYSPDPARLRSFIKQYGVDFIVLERGAFTREYVTSNSFIQMYPQAAAKALEHLEHGETPALLAAAGSCSVLDSGEFVVLKAECIATWSGN